MKCDTLTTQHWTLIHFYEHDAFKIYSRALRSGFWIVMHTKCAWMVQSKYSQDYTDTVWFSKNWDIELTYLYAEFHKDCVLTDEDIEHWVYIQKSLDNYFNNGTYIKNPENEMQTMDKVSIKSK